MKSLKHFLSETPSDKTAVAESVSTPANTKPFVSRYGKTWEDVLGSIASKRFGGGSGDMSKNESVDHTVSEAARGDNFNKGDKKSPGPLQTRSELDKVKDRHRDEDKRVKTRQRSERERAEISDFRSKDMVRKDRERKRVEKIRKGVYECVFIEELFNSIGNQKFETLLRNGLTKRSDMIRFKLALEKLSNGQTPTLLERDIFFNVFDRLVGFITEDPQLYTRVHQKAVKGRSGL